MNVFDLRGPEFLLFYLALLGASLLLAFFVRWWLRGPSDVPPFVKSIDAYDAAYLAGGPRMVVDAAITSLVHSGRVTVHLGTGLQPADAGVVCIATRSTFEQTILMAICASGMTISRLHSAAEIYARPVEERLRAASLVPTLRQSVLLRLASAAALLPALVIGMVKIFVGVSRNRPVGSLVFLWFLTGVLVPLLLARPPFRTRAGSRVLRRLRSTNSPLAASARTAPDRLADNDIALALALYGPSVLTGDLAPLRQALRPVTQSNSSGCSSGGGCGGGGGGGGCGGCGGGH